MISCITVNIRQHFPFSMLCDTICECCRLWSFKYRFYSSIPSAYTLKRYQFILTKNKRLNSWTSRRIVLVGRPRAGYGNKCNKSLCARFIWSDTNLSTLRRSLFTPTMFSLSWQIHKLPTSSPHRICSPFIFVTHFLFGRIDGNLFDVRFINQLCTILYPI